jgi:hypothetical protein
VGSKNRPDNHVHAFVFNCSLPTAHCSEKGARVRYATRLSSSAAAIFFCLLLTAAAAATAQAQSAPAPAATPRPAPQTAAPLSAPLDLRVRATERAIDESIPADPGTEAVIAPYSAKVHELDAPIGKLVGQLKKGGMGAGSLGNFVADALRASAEVKLGKPVLLAITNSGGLRKNEIAEGNLTASDIYELLPFENALIALDLTGEQLRRFLNIVVTHHDAQSGARITYRTNDKKESEIVAVKLGSVAAEKEIDPQMTYTIVTIDYLVQRGGDYSILQEAKNVRPLGLTMRDAVLDYVKTETAAGRQIKTTLDGRFSQDKVATTPATQPPVAPAPQNSCSGIENMGIYKNTAISTAIGGGLVEWLAKIRNNTAVTKIVVFGWRDMYGQQKSAQIEIRGGEIASVRIDLTQARVIPPVTDLRVLSCQ